MKLDRTDRALFGVAMLWLGLYSLLRLVSG